MHSSYLGLKCKDGQVLSKFLPRDGGQSQSYALLLRFNLKGYFRVGK